MQPVEVGLHDPQAAVAKLDGYDVVVAGAARLVGKKVKAQIARVLPGTAYATIVKRAKDGAAPITAEGEAEKPTRKPVGAGSRPHRKPRQASRRRRRAADASRPTTSRRTTTSDGEAPPKKKTRRGSRGGRKHKKTPTIHVPEAELGANGAEPAPSPSPRSSRSPRSSPSPSRPSPRSRPPPRRPSRRSPRTAPAPTGDRRTGETRRRRGRAAARAAAATGARSRAAAAPAETTESS